jgi:hypothetical protein
MIMTWRSRDRRMKMDAMHVHATIAVFTRYKGRRRVMLLMRMLMLLEPLVSFRKPTTTDGLM